MSFHDYIYIYIQTFTHICKWYKTAIFMRIFIFLVELSFWKKVFTFPLKPMPVVLPNIDETLGQTRFCNLQQVTCLEVKKNLNLKHEK